MPFIPVANTVEVELRMTLDDQKIENTLYFESANAPVFADMALLASNIVIWWDTSIAPLLPVDVVLREVVVTDLTSATGPQYSSALDGSNAGTLGQPALPNNVTLAVSFRTALRGRSFRGRNYVPALTEGQVVNNTVNSSVLLDYTNAYNAIITEVAPSDGPWTWVIVSRYSGVDSEGKPIPRVAGVTTPVQAAVIVDATIDSMRRRLPGRGR